VPTVLSCSVCGRAGAERLEARTSLRRAFVSCICKGSGGFFDVAVDVERVGAPPRRGPGSGFHVLRGLHATNPKREKCAWTLIQAHCSRHCQQSVNVKDAGAALAGGRYWLGKNLFLNVYTVPACPHVASTAMATDGQHPASTSTPTATAPATATAASISTWTPTCSPTCSPTWSDFRPLNAAAGVECGCHLIKPVLLPLDP
jgi:hypothetical protein